MRACRGKVISKETRKTLLCSAPHSQACFLLLSPPQAPFLTSGVCPTPSCCPPACRCQDTTVSLSFQGFKPVMSPVDCHVSGTLSGCLPFLRAQALLLAGRTYLPGLPWGSRQPLRLESGPQVSTHHGGLAPSSLAPSFPLAPPLPLSSSFP